MKDKPFKIKMCLSYIFKYNIRKHLKTRTYHICDGCRIKTIHSNSITLFENSWLYVCINVNIIQTNLEMQNRYYSIEYCFSFECRSFRYWILCEMYPCKKLHCANLLNSHCYEKQETWPLSLVTLKYTLIAFEYISNRPKIT